MTDSDELDRRLESHFATHERSLPPEVLARVVAELPSRGQVGPAREWLGRFGPAAAAVGLAAVVVLAVVAGPSVLDGFRGRPPGAGVGASPDASPAASATFSWDAVMSFREFPNQSNPSMDAYGHPAVWSYLEVEAGRHDPAEAERLTAFDRERDAWVSSAHPGLAIGWPLSTDSLVVAPYGRGPADRRAAVVAWRSPVDATVSIIGSVEVDASCGDGVEVWIDQGSQTLRAIPLPRGRAAIDLQASVRVGDTIYLGVEPGAAGDASCDTTWLKLLISA